MAVYIFSVNLIQIMSGVEGERGGGGGAEGGVLCAGGWKYICHSPG